MSRAFFLCLLRCHPHRSLNVKRAKKEDTKSNSNEECKVFECKYRCLKHIFVLTHSIDICWFLS